MTEIFAVSTILGGTVWQAVKVIRKAFSSRDIEVDPLVWAVLALVLGVSGAFFFQVDLSAIPSDAPEWVQKAVVGVFSAALGAGAHRIDTKVKGTGD